MIGIYHIKHSDSGKVYIGSACNIVKRWRSHRGLLNCGKHHATHLQYAWNKYGAAAFEFKVIELVATREELINREQYWIDLARSYESTNGYNVCRKAGSTLGTKRSAAANTKASLAMKGRKFTPEHCAKLSAANIANGNRPRMTQELYAQVAAKLRGRKCNPEGVIKRAAKRKGMKFSLEWRAALSAAKKGKKRAPFSAETRAKMSAAAIGRIRSKETRVLMSAVRLGKPLSDKARAAIKVSWQNPETIAKRLLARNRRRAFKSGWIDRSHDCLEQRLEQMARP